jgi:hypothetical protein
VLSDRYRCPAQINETAEAYVMSTLPRADTVTFEDHLLVCERCTATVAEIYNYVRAAKIAEQRLRSGRTRTASSSVE